VSELGGGRAGVESELHTELGEEGLYMEVRRYR
jgi:hypothetical protein